MVNFGSKKWLAFVILILLLADLAILLNIPFLRQIFGFLFLTILPGLLVLHVLKLNKLDFLEKFILTWGLSISFLMFFGLLINNLSLGLGYEMPLSTLPLLISFNLAFIILAAIGYKVNKESFSLPNVNLTTPEKAFLIIPILFPALSIFGMQVMNATENNIILMFLLFLIPIYVIFVCFFNQKFSKRLYPVVIFLISISLLLIFMLRFPHICGHDVQIEYSIFQTTLDNSHWSVFGDSTLDACLSISLLPTVYQSIMNINAQEYLFKGVYVSICSFSPVAIYIMSKKYVQELYAFLASLFFISQSTFLCTAGGPRTSIAIFFVSLACMILFSDKVNPLKKRALLIIFIISLIISHYSTAYIFFFIIFFTWFAGEIFSKKYAIKKTLTPANVLIFFVFIFFWYSQIIESAFNAGFHAIHKTLINLNNLFVEEVRDPGIERLFGQGLTHEMIDGVNLIVTWGTFILMGIGVLVMIMKYKEMILIPNMKFKKTHFLKAKFEIEYLAMALAYSGILVLFIVLPSISRLYGMHRVFGVAVIILSLCFVMGGITVSKYFKVRPYLVVLLILIPYFLFSTGVIYQICDIPIYTLSSRGQAYETEYIHDSETCAAKWLAMKGNKISQIYTTDGYGRWRLISQGKISSNRIDDYSFSEHKKVTGYIYLYYYNIISDKLMLHGYGYASLNMTEYSDMFIGKSKIYSSGYSEIYK